MTPTADVKATQLWFPAPHAVELRNAVLAPAHDEVLVQVSLSAISAGSELLVYRGQLPDAMALDSSIEALRNESAYPLRYGYASVGRVIGCGAGVDSSWVGRRVFAFQPHATHFVATPEALLAVPDAVPDEAAVFLPNMETAVNLVHDGAPLLGEHVVISGLGIVGLLLASLLAQYPLGSLHGIDPDSRRRALASGLGAMQAHDVDPDMLRSALAGDDGADLLFEVSGEPAALASALALSGFGSRIVVGSWYGAKSCSLPLGGAAHRNRITITTSQVSTVAASLGARWTKQRRFDHVWAQLLHVRPQQWIDSRVTLEQAPSVYKRLHERTDAPFQAVFVYPS